MYMQSQVMYYTVPICGVSYSELVLLFSRILFVKGILACLLLAALKLNEFYRIIDTIKH